MCKLPFAVGGGPRTFRSLFAVLFAGALALGCSETPGSLPSGAGSQAITAGQLGGNWSLSWIQPAGQAIQARPAGATYTLTFTDDRLSTRADCNVCGGTFVLSGETLTAGPALACTRAACSTMDFENAYVRLLSGDSAAAISGGTLILSSTRGILRFDR